MKTIISKLICCGVVCAFILADVVIGLITAISKHDYQSSKMRTGIWHKVGEILALAVMFGIEWGLPQTGVQFSIPLVYFMSGYLVVMEIGSIFEHLAVMSPEIAKPLSKILKTIQPEEQQPKTEEKQIEEGEENVKGN